MKKRKGRKNKKSTEGRMNVHKQGKTNISEMEEEERENTREIEKEIRREKKRK